MSHILENMLHLQNQLNRQINPDWLNAGYAWHRAIWLESAELMEHYGWKWWKAQEQDMEQIRLELIDIWHFGLSAELVRCQGDTEAAASNLRQQMQQHSSSASEVLELVDQLALHALQHHCLDMAAFLSLLERAGSHFDDLHRIYVGKNVLNRFRQDHGYKQGHYIKQWEGREDNEHLAEIAASLDAQAEDFAQRIYQKLEERYQANSKHQL